jgi:hypothetical protein
MGMVMKTFRQSAALWRQTEIIPEGQGSRDKAKVPTGADTQRRRLGHPPRMDVCGPPRKAALTTLPKELLKEGAGEEASGYANGLGDA